MRAKLKPNRALFCVLAFAGVYPLVTGLAYLMLAVAPGWAIWQRNLVAVPIIVLAMVFVIIPNIRALFRPE